jgi:glycosyltransferase involved in cell wall biosynthesis
MKRLAVIIPCKNEALRIDKNAFIQAIEKWPWISFCFIDDGSNDNTAEVLAHMTNLSPAIHAIYLPKNVGKAEAVRTGALYLLENTTAEYIGFWDADLSTPLSEIPAFMHHFETSDYTEIVIGSRWPHLGADINRSTGRGIAGALAKAFIRKLLKVHVSDTQCGAKIFSRSIAEKVFEKPFQTRWLFDVEILGRLGSKISTIVREHPLSSWYDVPGTKLGVRALLEIIRLPIILRSCVL